MSNWKIRFYDDEEAGRAQYSDTLHKSRHITTRFDIEPIESDEFRIGLDSLKRRQIALRDEGKWEGGPSLFDEISVLIVDYDLVKASDTGSFLTGANVSYYVRCFSKCKFIIGLNQFGNNPFDLTLKGHPESYADLDIGSEQLGNPGLWGGKVDGFRPWSWPDIPNYLSNLEEKVVDIKNNLNEKIYEFFGIPEDVVGVLPGPTSEFIGPELHETTFNDFLVKSGNGLARKDKKIENLDGDVQALLIASRISKWLEQLVLPGQNILIDGPHLVQRYPSLLEGNHTIKDTWDRTATFDEPDRIGIKHTELEEYRFKKSHWLSRPAWFFDKIINCQRIAEVADPWTREPTEFVFCEDSSVFLKKEECQDFIAELESPYVRRFVRENREQGIDYEPRVRFSL